MNARHPASAVSYYPFRKCRASFSAGGALYWRSLLLFAVFSLPVRAETMRRDLYLEITFQTYTDGSADYSGEVVDFDNDIVAF